MPGAFEITGGEMRERGEKERDRDRDREIEKETQKEYTAGAQLMFLKASCIFTNMWTLICYPDFLFFLLFLMFIYFEGERDRVRAGEGQRDRETQNPKKAPGSELSAQGLMLDSNSQTVRSRPEPKSDT